MHITIFALGSRGDVQPAIALGQGLERVGHTVRLAAGDNFRDWVYEHGLDFAPLGIDIREVMNTSAGIAWTQGGANPVQALRSMRALIDDYMNDALPYMIDACRDTDVLIGAFLSDPYLEAIAEKLNLPHISASLQPYKPSRVGASSLTALLPHRTTVINYTAGLLAQRVLWWISQPSVNALRTQYLSLPPHTYRSFQKALSSIPIVYGFSAHVVPPAPEWDDFTRVSGYWFLDEPSEWQPPAGLQHFMDAGDRPVYIGFGSMPDANPEATFKLIIDALNRAGLRGVIGGGWAGLKGSASDHVYLLDYAPHSWLFARMAVNVHHGGAGTTAAALRAGVPTLIVPHMGDQSFWANRAYGLGVSPKPLPRHKLTAELLAERLREAVSDTPMRDRAAALGEKIRAENGVATAVDTINLWLKLRGK